MLIIVFRYTIMSDIAGKGWLENSVTDLWNRLCYYYSLSDPDTEAVLPMVYGEFVDG